nr:1-deoxy-D-xylulose-5-phosphate synthase [Lachnospiraceae bacterium]
KVEKKGEGLAIFAVGSLLPIAMKAAEILEKKTGKKITVVNPRFVSGLDEVLLTKLMDNHKTVITIEDGELQGGYGQTIASFYGDKDMKVINHGISKKFHSDFKPAELLAEHGISAEKLAEEAEKLI